MPKSPKPELEAARRYAAEVEQGVIRQLAVIQDLVRANRPQTADLARRILLTLIDILDRARDHVRTLEREADRNLN